MYIQNLIWYALPPPKKKKEERKYPKRTYMRWVFGVLEAFSKKEPWFGDEKIAQHLLFFRESGPLVSNTHIAAHNCHFNTRDFPHPLLSSKGTRHMHSELISTEANTLMM